METTTETTAVTETETTETMTTTETAMMTGNGDDESGDRDDDGVIQSAPLLTASHPTKSTCAAWFDCVEK